MASRSPHSASSTFLEGVSRRAKRPLVFGPWVLFLLVVGAQFAFGMWMNSRGFLWNDALSRATNALQVLHSKEPSLAVIGFVWMPLPSLIELLWVSFFPLWPQIVSSGFASTLTTALAGGATAALLLYTARRLGLSDRLGWAFALVVTYLLVPRPSGAPSDFIVVRRPALWLGGESDFELVKSFPETPSKWRLYKVVEQPAREGRTDQ
jgi:hypothetical protein